MAYHYNTRARARSDVEPDDISQGDLDVEMTAAIVSESATVGSVSYTHLTLPTILRV